VAPAPDRRYDRPPERHANPDRLRRDHVAAHAPTRTASPIANSTP
jgi:hypothetical protein